MSTRALIIDDKVQAAINAALADARRQPMSLDEVKRIAVPNQDVLKLDLKDRAPNAAQRAHEPTSVLIPIGYRASVSFEQQPVGLCVHLSISVDRPGWMPSRESVDMIAGAFGLKMPLDGKSEVWLEEFAPGHHAVNIVQLSETMQ
jgi:hypothetical protein